MSTIHFIGGEKGGVGKSVLARVLSQYCIDRAEPHMALDADQSHATLSRYYEDFTEPMNLDSFESTDAIMEKAAERDAQVIIDLPAQSQRFLDRWMAESGVLELCEEMGMPLVYWYTVDDGPDSMQLLERFLDTYGNTLQSVVVRNHGCGTDFADVDKLLEQHAYNADSPVLQFDLPALHAQTMHKVDKRHLSFWAAVNLKEKGSQHLSLMERQRTKVWLKKAYAGIDAVLDQVALPGVQE